jgi:hypothetical protein
MLVFSLSDTKVISPTEKTYSLPRTIFLCAVYQSKGDIDKVNINFSNLRDNKLYTNASSIYVGNHTDVIS